MCAAGHGPEPTFYLQRRDLLSYLSFPGIMNKCAECVRECAETGIERERDKYTEAAEDTTSAESYALTQNNSTRFKKKKNHTKYWKHKRTRISELNNAKLYK